MSKKINKSLYIEGREWFDKVNGNSYFSARIWIDGEVRGILPFQYGYGDQYTYEARKWLINEGYIFDTNSGLWSIAQREGFDFYYVKSSHKKSEMFKPSTYVKVGA